MKHKDFLGQSITVGDEIVYIKKNGRDAVSMCRAFIIRETPKFVEVVHRYNQDYGMKYLVRPGQVVKIDPSL